MACKVVDRCGNESTKYFSEYSRAIAYQSGRQEQGDCGYQLGSRSSDRFSVYQLNDAEEELYRQGRLSLS